MKIINKLFLIILTSLILNTQVFSSELHFIPLEDDIKNINFILQVEVTNIKKESSYMKLPNGQDGPMTSTSIIISGKIKEIVWGKCKLSEVKTAYTWIVPIKYDKDGNHIMSFSPITSGSGIENDVEMRKDYLFSFRNIYEIQPVQHHMRMDLLSNKNKILELLNK